jgi:hypothetical protein
MTDCNEIIERMRVTGTTAQIVARYPNGAAVAGFNKLINERVTVRYTAVAADPLEVAVDTRWTTKGRNMVITLTTKIGNKRIISFLFGPAACSKFD